MRRKRPKQIVHENTGDQPIEVPTDVNVSVLKDGTRVWIGDGKTRRKKGIV